jgi:hypothetical protein
MTNNYKKKLNTVATRKTEKKIDGTKKFSVMATMTALCSVIRILSLPRAKRTASKEAHQAPVYPR